MLLNDVTQSCSLCASLKSIPRELLKQSTSELPDTIGKSFSADVLRHDNQKIIFLLDIFSSFVVGIIIPDEQHSTLREAII